MNRVKAVALGLGVAGAIGTGVVLVPAFAEDATKTPDSAATAVEERHKERESKFAELLAKELGLETSKVQEALKAVREQMRAEVKADRLEALDARLDQAVKDGKLTQEEADAILKAAKNGVFMNGLGKGRFGHPHGGPRGHGPAGFGPGGMW